jgi:hypothetical protein
MRRPDGTPWIHSFAHGRATYELKYDAAAVRKAIEQADEKEVVEMFVTLVVAADLNDVEETELRDLAVKRSGAGARSVARMLKTAQRKHASEHARQERKRRTAERTDHRPAIDNPDEDAPWIEQMDVINDVLGVAKVRTPPARDIDDDMSQVEKMCVPGTHAFTAASGNAEGEEIND